MAYDAGASVATGIGGLEGRADDFESAARALAEKATADFPKSTFATWWTTIGQWLEAESSPRARISLRDALCPEPEAACNGLSPDWGTRRTAVPISPELKPLAEQLRKLAAQEEREEVAAEMLRRAELIEPGADGSGGPDHANPSRKKRATPKLAGPQLGNGRAEKKKSRRCGAEPPNLG